MSASEGVTVRRCAGERAGEMRARVLSRRPLLYGAGGSSVDDVPAHVRAGSGVVVTRTRVAIVQDDTNVLALIDRDAGTVRPVLLPRGEGGARQFGEDRGNKKHKLDLEACVLLPHDGGTLLAFGSGSKPARERVLVVRGLDAAEPSVRVCDAPALYRAFSRHAGFSGSELNVEGVARVGDSLRFFQRGNGAPVGDLHPLDATADVSITSVLASLESADAPVALTDVRVYALGALDGVRLTFTDAFSEGAEPVWFLAAAEASPDTYHDGVVTGSALGFVDERGTARWCPIEDERGGAFADKAEGLAFEPGRRDRAWVVVDKDDTTAPCELCELSVEGF